ncbi:MAG: penicillin-binding protein 2 [Acidimicrobiia bacterium]
MPVGPHRLRLGVLGIATFSLFAALFARLYYLQVMTAPTAERQALQNGTQTIQIPPVRGRILDRNGVVLAKNKKSTVVTVERDVIRKDKNRAALWQRLAPTLGLTVDALEARWKSLRYDQRLPLPIAEDIDDSMAGFLEERIDEFPGVQVTEQAVRTYPYGFLASHVIGYVGTIAADEAAQRRAEGYLPNDLVGKTGIEKIYESELRGKPGKRVLQVDAKGRVLGTLQQIDPVPGNDVQLTIDAQVQLLTEQALNQGLIEARAQSPADDINTPLVDESQQKFSAPAGAAVVQDPETGEVVAMASNPTYDPREFIGGISNADVARLYGTPQEPKNQPLLNRGIQGEYAPASTFKLVTATAALSYGMVDQNSVFDDQGYFFDESCKDTKAKCTYYNAGRTPWGKIDITRAITVSSDAFFYDVGATFWYQREKYAYALQEEARAYGFGTQSGIQLPDEAKGRVPDGDSKKAIIEANPGKFSDDPGWRTGDNINTAIGQGLMSATPLQIVNAYSAFANGGKVFSPNIALRILKAGTNGSSPSDVVRQIEPRQLKPDLSLPSVVHEPILNGLRGVLSDSKGTAFNAFAGFDLKSFSLAGKTGTAQDNTQKSVNDNSLFVAFGPAEPKYTVMALLEKAGFGGKAAAPVVRRIFEGLQDPSSLPALRIQPEPTHQPVEIPLLATPLTPGLIIDSRD